MAGPLATARHSPFDGPSFGPSFGRSWLAWASLGEAMTLLILLFVAVPLKHAAGLPVGVEVMGPVHGAAVLAFAYLLIEAVAAGEVGARAAFLLVLGALVPFGGFFGVRMLAGHPTGETRANHRPAGEPVLKTIIEAVREFA